MSTVCQPATPQRERLSKPAGAVFDARTFDNRTPQPESDQEKKRLAALYAFELLDTASSEDFDRICRLAAESLGVPTALISLVDRDRQWFKSRVGFDRPQTPIAESFCAHAVASRDFLTVPDATLDPRFESNPLVTGDSHVRFYAGAPLVTRDGHAIGTLCVLDQKPRELDETHKQRLVDYASLVMNQIETRQLVRRRDPVTGLPNRQQFLADLCDLPSSAPVQSRLLVLLDLFDIAQLDGLIRSLGVDVMETFIRALAQRLRKGVDGTAQVYHVDTTRFAFSFSGETAEATRFIENLVSMLRKPALAGALPVEPPVIAGVVSFENTEKSVAHAYRKALGAIADASGQRVPVTIYNDEKDRAECRAIALAAELPTAMARGDFWLAFQPRIALGNSSIVGVEALLRWKHPTLGPLSPAEFIPVIEKTPHIHLVTGWVLDQSLARLSGWSVPSDFRISINLSPRDFTRPGLASLLENACRRHNVPTSQLEVEITEGQWLHDSKSVLHELESIRACGIHIAIDDFGTGYSNFAYLKHIPADVLKIDKSLVSDLPSNARHREITRSIIALAQTLGYYVVAEGIETQACLELVASYGTDGAQGFHFAKPLPEDELLSGWLT